MYVWWMKVFAKKVYYFLWHLANQSTYLPCSKKDPGSLSKVVPILRYTMADENVNILKRVLVCVNQLYRLTLEVYKDILLYNIFGLVFDSSF